MLEQLGLDLEQPPVGPAARPTDPPASHDAARAVAGVGASSQADRVLEAADQLARRHGRHRGFTAREVVEQLEQAGGGPTPQQSVVARRITDLRQLGYVVESVWYDEATDTTGVERRDRCTVWHLTVAGLEQAARR